MDRLIILIDGDMVACRAAGAAQSQHYMIDTGHVYEGQHELIYGGKTKKSCRPLLPGEKLVLMEEHEPVSHALQIAKEMLKGIEREVIARFPGYDEYIIRIYVGGESKDNFRYAIAKTQPYKHKRGKKPFHTQAVEQYLVEYHDAITVTGQETDDALGIQQTSLNDQGIDSIIISNDKDLNMIPGWHYNYPKKEFFFQTEYSAMRAFYFQMLTGDATDTIPGIRNIGPKTACWILNEASGPPSDIEIPDVLMKSMHEAVWDTYQECNLSKYHSENDGGAATTKYFLEQGQLLWIRRREGEIWDGTADFYKRQINESSVS